MKNLKLKNFVKKNSVYIAVASCAIIVGGAGIITYNKTVKDINTDLTNVNTPPTTTTTTTTTKKTELSIDIGNQLATLTQTQPKFMPVSSNVILNPFSNGELVKNETLNVWKTHDGVDIQANVGETVKAMTKGVVKEVKNDTMWGTCVIIEHSDGVTGYYCNLSTAVNVKAGDSVDAGDKIGVVGETAQAEISMKPHLHFALKQNGDWIDPIQYIDPSIK